MCLELLKEPIDTKCGEGLFIDYNSNFGGWPRPPPLMTHTGPPLIMDLYHFKKPPNPKRYLLLMHNKLPFDVKAVIFRKV